LVFYLLDTDTASFIIKGKSAAMEARLAGLRTDQVGISAVTRAELMYGLKRLAPGHRLHAGVRQFFNIVPALAWDERAADFYAEIRHQLMLSGQPIGDPDMMIAAHALTLGAVLVTNNVKHFQRISVSAALVIENWV
jgi:tRNA(fMet)-specific endonuclease VapC